MSPISLSLRKLDLPGNPNDHSPSLSIVLGAVPGQVVEVHSVEMEGGHREVYNTLYSSARAAFKAALAMGEAEVKPMTKSRVRRSWRRRDASTLESKSLDAVTYSPV